MHLKPPTLFVALALLGSACSSGSPTAVTAAAPTTSTMAAAPTTSLVPTNAAAVEAPTAIRMPTLTAPLGLEVFDPLVGTVSPTPWAKAWFALPACAEGAPLRQWTLDAIGRFTDPPGTLEIIPLEEAAEQTPLLVREAPTATCAIAVGDGTVTAWELQDVGGNSIARAATDTTAGGRFEARRDQQPGNNFGQSQLASGQFMVGRTAANQISGVIETIDDRRSLFVAELRFVPDNPLLGNSVFGGQQAGWFSYPTLERNLTTYGLVAPTAAPPGFERCSGVVEGTSAHGKALYLCSASGDFILVDRANARPDQGDPQLFVFAEPVVELTDGRRVARASTPDEDISVNAPESIDEPTLVAMIESIPMLDERAWRPRTGTALLRDVLLPADIVELFAAAGATDMTAIYNDLITCQLECAEPDPTGTIDIAGQRPDGVAFEGQINFAPAGQDQWDWGGAGSAVVIPLDTIDVLGSNDAHSLEGRATCGDTRFRIRSDIERPAPDVGYHAMGPIVELLATTLSQVDC